ncbi:hypothetical protein SLEP1_g34910 [Rubroshorea leprosula]|uniref:Uncharacterized protein n=1 Tax=Rubroshorea leprosula TaxID=152421 RepID=A0AAV5KLJ6_9ROSI|nr:hypothetical protein SLEP1_g34910 [Rubroshorea leprosula]
MVGKAKMVGVFFCAGGALTTALCKGTTFKFHVHLLCITSKPDWTRGMLLLIGGNSYRGNILLTFMCRFKGRPDLYSYVESPGPDFCGGIRGTRAENRDFILELRSYFYMLGKIMEVKIKRLPLTNVVAHKQAKVVSEPIEMESSASATAVPDTLCVKQPQPGQSKIQRTIAVLLEFLMTTGNGSLATVGNIFDKPPESREQCNSKPTLPSHSNDGIWQQGSSLEWTPWHLKMGPLTLTNLLTAQASLEKAYEKLIPLFLLL